MAFPARPNSLSTPPSSNPGNGGIVEHFGIADARALHTPESLGDATKLYEEHVAGTTVVGYNCGQFRQL